MITHPLRLQCQEVVEHVSELVDRDGGALAPLDVIRLEQHLLVCPPCTLYVHQLRETIAIAHELPVGPAAAPAPAAAADALAAFRRWKAKTP